MLGSESTKRKLLPQLDNTSDADRPTVQHCLNIVVARSDELKRKGLSPQNFFCGVTNALLVTWVFGVWPEHFWIVYIVETLILFPLRWMHMTRAKPLPEILSWLDFCWVANIVGNIVLVIYLVNDFWNNVKRGSAPILHEMGEEDVRRALFCVFWGVAMGPLLCSAGVLKNALVFHDVDNTISVFIHLCPSLLMFTLRWQADRVLAAWPGLFHLNYFDSIGPWRDVYLKAVIAYFTWFVPFTLWMVTCGLKMPSKGYDTIFHSMMRGSNPVAPILGWSKEEQVKRAKNNDFTIPSVLIYMLFHAVASCTSMLVAVACWMSVYVHGLACLAMTLSVIYNGSARYSYYVLDNYTTIMRKEFSELLETDEQP